MYCTPSLTTVLGVQTIRQAVPRFLDVKISHRTLTAIYRGKWLNRFKNDDAYLRLERRWPFIASILDGWLFTLSHQLCHNQALDIAMTCEDHMQRNNSTRALHRNEWLSRLQIDHALWRGGRRQLFIAFIFHGYSLVLTHRLSCYKALNIVVRLCEVFFQSRQIRE
jgi:hypothetical protein